MKSFPNIIYVSTQKFSTYSITPVYARSGPSYTKFILKMPNHMAIKRSKRHCTESSSVAFVVVRFCLFVVSTLCIGLCASCWVTVSCAASTFSELVCLVAFSPLMLFPWLPVNKVRVACSCPICFVTLIVVGSPQLVGSRFLLLSDSVVPFISHVWSTLSVSISPPSTRSNFFMLMST